MLDGTIFKREQAPSDDLQLPQTCWAVYDRIDGETPIGVIADALRLTPAETFAVVQQLQAYQLIAEPVLSYATYSAQQSDDAKAASSETADAGDSALSNSDTSDTPVLHLPSLWDWLEDASSNVKEYKNTRAFVLMEAADVFEALGATSVEDLKALEYCRDPEAVAVIEEAVKGNTNQSIPDICYL